MLATLLPVLPVILLFALGALLRKISFFSPSSVAEMKKLVSNIALPALLFQAFFSIEIEAKYLILVAIVFLICGLMVIIGRIFGKLLKVDSPYFSLMMGGFEMGMLGYALFLGLYGTEHLGKIALVDMGQVLFVFFVLMTLLIKERGGASHPLALLKEFVTSPVIIAIVAGLVASFLKGSFSPNPFFTLVEELLVMVSSLTVPLIAITIGYGIYFERGSLRDTLKTILVRKAASIIFLLLLNALVITRLLKMDPMYRAAATVMLLTPPPFVISIFMDQSDKKNLDYVDNTLSLDTVVSIVLILLFATFYA